ncbi:MAG: hypothetical protein O8C66_13505 [Candidatus Methanoperedens sp.]|nr:hypothetical protein [Candidatus Methanoperedens sp.]MCZ7371514.1 hypothetical protein [Candidatus Methanoperedens sp.]
MKIKENKKMILMSKINLALSIGLLAFVFYNVLKNIHEGRPFYTGSVIFGFLMFASIFSWLIIGYHIDKKGEV